MICQWPNCTNEAVVTCEAPAEKDFMFLSDQIRIVGRGHVDPKFDFTIIEMAAEGKITMPTTGSIDVSIALCADHARMLGFVTV